MADFLANTTNINTMKHLLITLLMGHYFSELLIYFIIYQYIIIRNAEAELIEIKSHDQQ